MILFCIILYYIIGRPASDKRLEPRRGSETADRCGPTARGGERHDTRTAWSWHNHGTLHPSGEHRALVPCSILTNYLCEMPPFPLNRHYQRRLQDELIIAIVILLLLIIIMIMIINDNNNDNNNNIDIDISININTNIKHDSRTSMAAAPPPLFLEGNWRGKGRPYIDIQRCVCTYVCM